MTQSNKDGCPTCLGIEARDFFSRYCDDHNVCVSCGINRKDLTENPWGDRRGAFQCKPCEKIERDKRIEDRKSSGFDHEYTDEVVCPNCGYEFGDSWEMDDGTHDCPDCEQKFHLEKCVSVTYTTEIV